MFRNRFVCVLSCFLSTGFIIVEAQDKTASEVPAAPAQPAQQDFGKGFAMLFKMGLPRLEGAKPATVNIYSGPASTYEYGINIRDDRNISWLKTPDKNTEPALCIIGGVFECKLYDQAALMKIQAEKAKKSSNKKLSRRQMYSIMMPEQNCFSGQWKATTSDKVADDIKKTLQDKNNQYIFQSDKSKYGLLLLQAAQLYESGAKSEANEIAGLLFKAGGNKEVLQSALSVLAEAKYLRAYCDFQESKDWGKFSADLEKIIVKFKNNWDNVRYVKAIQVAAAARAKNQEPPELKTSIPLTAADRDLVAQLSRMTQDDYNGSWQERDCWLFPDNDNKDNAEDDKEQKSVNALDKVKAGGIKSIPLLIAMLDDEWLLPFRDSGYFRRISGGEESSDEEQAAETKPEVSLSETADRFEMPLTRAKLAAKLLTPLIIPENKEQEYAIFGKKGDELKAMCLAWYESIKKLDAKELQKKYLADGTESQKAAIVASMVARVDDATAPMIEKALLESDRNMMNQNLLARYCEIRKEKAKPFIEKLRTKCYQQLDEQFNKQNSYEGISKENAKKALDQFFDQLDQTKPSASLEDVVKELLTITDEKELNFVAQKFLRAAKGQPSEKIYQSCLDAAVLAKDPKQKLFLLYMTQIADENKQQSKLDITKFKVQLEKLLDDKSELPEKFGGKQAIMLMAAGIIEGMSKEKLEDEASGMQEQEQAGMYIHWDDKYAQYLVLRAKAILAETPVDKLPKLVNAEELKDAQIVEAKSKISGKSEAEVKDFCRQATLEELIPLSVAVQQDKQLNSKLLLLANQITEADSEIPEIKEQVAKFKGKQLNEQVLQEVLALAENYMQNGKMADVSLLRRSGLQGVVLKFSKSENRSGMGNAKRNHNDTGAGMLSAYLMFGDSSNENMSRAVAVKNKPQEKKPNENDLDKAMAENADIDSSVSQESQKEQEKKFMDAFSENVLKNGNALWSGKIIITGISY